MGGLVAQAPPSPGFCGDGSTASGVSTSQPSTVSADVGGLATSKQSGTWSFSIALLSFTSTILDDDLILAAGDSFTVAYTVQRQPDDNADYESLRFEDSFDFGIPGLTVSNIPSSPCGGSVTQLS